MKMLLLLTSIALSSSVFAKPCQVDVQHEIRLDGQNVEIHRADGQVAILGKDDQLTVDGERIVLNDAQRQALAAYRTQLNTYIPKAQDFATQTLALADGVLDDVAKSIESPNAFDSVKVKMRSLVNDVQSRYYHDEQLILPAEGISDMTNTWQQDLDRAKAVFNQEFMTSAFQALSEKMSRDGGINLTALSENMTELTASIEQRLREHSGELEQQGIQWCDSLEKLAAEEQALRQSIPALAGYTVLSVPEKQ